MVSIAGITVPIPMTIGSAIGFFINALLAFAVILILDRVIAHEFDVRHSFIMAVGAYFLTPIVFSLINKLALNIPSAISTYILPLIVWVVLGEILLGRETDMKTKASVAVVAFAVYTVLTLLGVPGTLSQVLPF